MQEGCHPWLSFDRTQGTIEHVRDQLMTLLSSIKPSMQSNSNFCNRKLAVAKDFRSVFRLELGTDAFYQRADKRLENRTTPSASA